MAMRGILHTLAPQVLGLQRMGHDRDETSGPTLVSKRTRLHRAKHPSTFSDNKPSPRDIFGRTAISLCLMHKLDRSTLPADGHHDGALTYLHSFVFSA
jgi:hypothetical protein